MLIFRKNSKAELLLRFDRRTSCTFRNLTAADKTHENFTRVETTSVLVAPTATAIWRKRGATEQNKRGQHTPENATELTMTTSRAAVEGRALLSDMLRCATLSMLALASQASRRHVSPPLGAPHNHSRRATRTPRRAWGRCRCAQAELQLGSLVSLD